MKKETPDEEIVRLFEEFGSCFLGTEGARLGRDLSALVKRFEKMRAEPIEEEPTSPTSPMSTGEEEYVVGLS